jgi:hypothetical protein
VKRTRSDEQIGVVIHIFMETTLGISLCSYLYLKLAKMSCFFFYLLCFFFHKTDSAEGRGIGTVRGWQWQGKNRRTNMVQTMYTHACNCCRNQGKVNEGEQWRV